ncbi:NADH-dehydrogenase (ubiquinone) [Phaffia rhodozyma]|uniref:NADH-dehydrogenase (Ubiquinone) n=1 Tax=Phaffia rhodozyma TaxID=264483 RepID=A0A0F7SRV2_PHARH|nr:NADH-dehydrogenase (ubiquinone) [Phaffia rhodozyma]
MSFLQRSTRFGINSSQLALARSVSVTKVATAVPVDHGMKVCNPKTSTKRERVVVLGSGWGGFTVAKNLDPKLYDVTVVSPTGYFTFTPLLASTSVGTLEFRTALEPVRRLKNVNLSMARAESIDFKTQTVTLNSAVPSPATSSSHSLPPRAHNKAMTIAPEKHQDERFVVGYDKLVISVGAFSATFGTPGVYEHAHFLKDIRDARAIRKRILDCFERASQPFIKEAEIRALLAFRIVGGGPTGIEFAAELHDLITSDMKRIYPDLVGFSTISLYDVAPGILLSFEESLREYAMRRFSRDNVIVRPNSRVLEVGPGWMEIEGEGKVPFGLLVWSTGLEPNPLIKSISQADKDPRSQSLFTDNFLRVLDKETGEPMKNVYAIGDNSMIKDGPKLPATAQVANQKALNLAANLNNAGTEKPDTEFILRNKGSMVYLGSWRAIIDRTATNVSGPKGEVTGLSAWFLWRSAYWSMSSWRNRLLMSVYWGMNLITGRDISRF